MAGGRFDKSVGKVRPGIYINFEGNTQEPFNEGSRGIVIVPIIKSNYGPAKKYIKITSSSPNAASTQLGYSITDSDANRQMLLIREALKRASTVYAYILTEGNKASIETTLETTTETGSETTTLTATAKYGGSRGNDLSFTIYANPVEGFDVQVNLAGSKVAEYEGLNTIKELIEQDCPYITFAGTGSLAPVAGANLTEGTDETAQNDDVSAFCDAWEAVKFNTVCFPVTDTSLQEVARNKIMYMRDNMGKGVQVVMPDVVHGDYEGIISVTNSVAIGDEKLTHAEACAWVAGATAGAENTESLTYSEYEGATEIVDPKTHEEAVSAINNGEFFFSVSEAGAVVAEYDINTLVTFTDGKDKTYRKNRVIRVFDSFAEELQLNFPPNKFNNDENGLDVMEGIGSAVLKQFEDSGAITDVDYSNDFVVDKEASSGDETYFNVGLKPLDSAEKLYFTVATR